MTLDLKSVPTGFDDMFFNYLVHHDVLSTCLILTIGGFGREILPAFFYDTVVNGCEQNVSEAKKQFSNPCDLQC